MTMELTREDKEILIELLETEIERLQSPEMNQRIARPERERLELIEAKLHDQLLEE